MKQYFYFFFDKKNKLCCINECNYQLRKYKNEFAKDKLLLADSLNIQKIIIKDNKMNLFSCNNSITIANFDSFCEKKYLKLMPNINNVIEDSFRCALMNNRFSSSTNLTLYTNNYKNKVAIKGGIITLFSALTIIGSLALYKNGINSSIQKQSIKDIDYTISKVVDFSNELLIVNENISKYLEEIKTEKDEQVKKNYSEFTSYNDETMYAYDNYFNLVYDEATRWGLDPNLVMAMLIQESKGRSANLMQISYSSWKNKSFDCYDFIDQIEKTVYLNDLNTPEGNIRAACMILRYSIKNMNNNIMAGVQCYNLGDGNMDAVLRAACIGENMKREEILANQDDLLFVPYTKYATGGDKHYINNIKRYLNDTDYLYYLDIDENNNIVEYKYNMKEKEKILTK